MLMNIPIVLFLLIYKFYDRFIICNMKQSLNIITKKKYILKFYFKDDSFNFLYVKGDTSLWDQNVTNISFNLIIFINDDIFINQLINLSKVFYSMDKYTTDSSIISTDSSIISNTTFIVGVSNMKVYHQYYPCCIDIKFGVKYVTDFKQCFNDEIKNIANAKEWHIKCNDIVQPLITKNYAIISMGNDYMIYPKDVYGVKFKITGNIFINNEQQIIDKIIYQHLYDDDFDQLFYPYDIFEILLTNEIDELIINVKINVIGIYGYNSNEIAPCNWKKYGFIK